VRSIVADIATAGDMIADLGRELGRLGQQFANDSPWDAAGQPATAVPVVDDVRSATTESLRCRIAEFVRLLDERIQTEFLQPRGGLRAVCQRGDEMRSALVPALRTEGRRLVLGALQDTSIDRAALGPSADDCEPRLQACLDAARPKLDRCGGAQRLVAIAPEHFAESELAEAFIRKVDPPPTVVLDGDADLVLCYESRDLWIPYVAARLVGERGDLVQAASRLHTRTDVDWADLARLTAPVEPAPAGG
jgi:hypothetical protein